MKFCSVFGRVTLQDECGHDAWPYACAEQDLQPSVATRSSSCQPKILTSVYRFVFVVDGDALCNMDWLRFAMGSFSGPLLPVISCVLLDLFFNL